MSEETKNKQCQICQGYLFEDDDTVVCPTCGAPHHRDCWDTVGHCGVEADHGTDRQYDLLQKNKADSAAQEGSQTNENIHTCPYCHRTSNAPNAEFCPYCGHSYNQHAQQAYGFKVVNPFDIYGGLPKDTTIDGVTVKDLATFVGSNSHRYMNRFSQISKRKKGSWNWAAFLFPSGWCLSRKMVPLGIMYVLLAVASTICLVPFLEIYYELLDGQNLSYAAQYALIENNLDKFDLFSMILAFAGLALNLIPRIICGRFGDWNYRCFAINKVKTILNRDDVEDLPSELAHSGNISLAGLIAAMLATQFLPSIITMFIA